MHVLKVQQFPNAETRLTAYKLHPPVNPFREKEAIAPPDSTNVPSPHPAPILDITSDFATTVPGGFSGAKTGFGRIGLATRFGNNARRTIIRAGAVMEATSSHPSDTLLLTGTLPGSTRETFAAIAAYSGYIVHRLKAWVAKYHQDVNSLYVWEYQSRGALHLHYALLVPDYDKRRRILNGFHDQWVRLLCGVSDTSGVDLFDSGKGFSYRNSPDKVQTDAQEITRSVGRYLAKYLSKSATQRLGCPDSWVFPPSRWYGVSRPLLHKLKEMTKEEHLYYNTQGECLGVMEDMRGVLQNGCEPYYTYEHSQTGTQVTVGYQSNLSFEELICMTHQQERTSSEFRTTLNPSVWMTTLLRSTMQRYSITPSHFAGLSTQTLQEGLSNLSQSKSLSIIEAMEIAHTLGYMLRYRYRDRNTQPPYLARDVERLSKVWLRLREIRAEKNLAPDTPLSFLD